MSYQPPNNDNVDFETVTYTSLNNDNVDFTVEPCCVANAIADKGSLIIAEKEPTVKTIASAFGDKAILSLQTDETLITVVFTSLQPSESGNNSVELETDNSVQILNTQKVEIET